MKYVAKITLVTESSDKYKSSYKVETKLSVELRNTIINLKNKTK